MSINKCAFAFIKYLILCHANEKKNIAKLSAPIILNVRNVVY
jgi:hypothetical protein